jgi:ornithine decarboxylase
MTRLPADMRVDDWLGWDNMGAYTVCAASRFNGFETSNITYTSGLGYPSVKVRTALRRLAAVDD